MSDNLNDGLGRREAWNTAQMAAALKHITPRGETEFREWLLRAGWRQVGQGPLGDLVARGDATVALPAGMWQDPTIAAGVVDRVAEAMALQRNVVAHRLAAPLADRIEFRLIGEALQNGRVPLGAASEALKNGRRLLSASGTSAITPAWSVARRYRPEAQRVARDAELAHTEDGSFVFPLYITLDGDSQDPIDYPDGSIILEPYARRVTRTLATAVASAASFAGTTIDRMTDNDLDTASSLGVSRELCMSLDELMKNPSVAEVEINFDWSSAFGSTETLPNSVAINREARPRLRALAKRLSRPEPISSEIYVGPILEIGHSSQEDQESGFYFVLDTYFRDRQRKARVMLTEEQHERSIPWYQGRATVIVSGTAVEQKTGLLILSPTQLEAWSNPAIHFENDE